MKLFGKLSKLEKEKIRRAQSLNKLEVHCPWWPKGHWEHKLPDSELWDEAYYRITKKKAEGA